MMHILRWSAFLVFCLVASNGCGSGGKSSSSGLEAAFTYVGTWVQPAYSDGKGPPAKIVFTDNTLAFYTLATDTKPSITGSLSLNEDWTADGGHYFSCSGIGSGIGSAGSGYVLMRVSGNNNTLEANISSTPPSAIDSSAGTKYGIWTRQQ